MAKATSDYNRKRNFESTSEPRETGRRSRAKAGALRFVVQKHDARHLHYDFRLELEGTLKSWAVPKGPSLDPSQKRLAVHVEDHPLAYASFEGSIAEGNYGAGDVIVWDHGIWQPEGDPVAAYEAGKLKFSLVGEKLSGAWTLVRTRLKGSGDKQQWLLIKEQDDVARPADEYDIVSELPASVISGELVGGMAKPAANQASKAKPRGKTPAKAAKAATKAKAGKTARSVMPDTLSPQLATLVEAPPAGDWIYEIKYDGYRIMARIEAREVTLFSRNGHDWTARMVPQAKALAKLGLGDSWLDGEAVVLDEQGMPDFQALQNAFDEARSGDILYFLFDAPWLDGVDQRELPVEQRRAALLDRLPKRRGPLRFSEAFEVDHQSVLGSACALGLEGVIGKRAGSPYRSSRSADWIKLKCRQRQEFVVVGFTKPQGSRSGFGALLLAVNEDKGLRYAGRVGTGFNEALLGSLHKRMKALARDDSPLHKQPSAAQRRGVQWIEPQLVVEVAFAGWTGEGLVRQGAFVGERSDKPAEQIVEEQAAPAQAVEEHAARDKPSAKASGRKGREQIGEVSVSHPERVVDEQSGTTKAQLARFYAEIAEWLLPEVRNRPVSLLRAPSGVGGEQFFQKHAERLDIPNIRHLDAALDPGHDRLMTIDSVPALVGAVQMGTLELHTWNAAYASIEKPDRLILDLDPDPALPWRAVLEATRLSLAVLDELGLEAFLKTSGGSGMHLVVPLARHIDWDTLKAFGKAFSQFMASELPDRFSARMGPKNRIGKVYVDYLRNGRGASTVAAYSVRARPGLPVSVPIGREELAQLRDSKQWHIGNLQQRLAALSDDPWAGYANRQRISQAMWKKLGAEAP
ncbi:DNA ligase D [Pseudomonas argentinensis]|uniref:DNA ligase (ATP) n=1 Tax=Phytopseudomonas argentinensis TaxID=289370 RepID=A0A1I3GQZ6_9GAMM|nr:DNA ligase D [Pseudomonas argentinensis]KAB0548957.1 DNA ligase D [Pseudomonas argentinensis]SFI25771.1 ATP-dependent DNA ligase LigD phosphoesterase module /ATP-dependent DNA ligase LigD polymerase module [Pseudomonas argentinensis]